MVLWGAACKAWRMAVKSPVLTSSMPLQYQASFLFRLGNSLGHGVLVLLHLQRSKPICQASDAGIQKLRVPGVARQDPLVLCHLVFGEPTNRTFCHSAF